MSTVVLLHTLWLNHNLSFFFPFSFLTLTACFAEDVAIVCRMLILIQALLCLLVWDSSVENERRVLDHTNRCSH